MPLDLDRTERDSASAGRAGALQDFDVHLDDAASASDAAAIPAPKSSRAPLSVSNPLGRVMENMRAGVVAFRNTTVQPMVEAAGTVLKPVSDGVGELWGRVRPRLGLKSLYWRILIVNLSGLAVMLLGILFLSAQQDWLIEAKRESIQAQAQMIADAIVREATSDERGFGFPDPDQLLEGDRGRNLDLRSYELQDFAFAIQPEKVAPILQRYSNASGQRARIYARDGTMIYDSAGFSNRVIRRDLLAAGESESPMIQSFWTRLDSLFMPSNMPIYREIGRANGRAYPEVAAALEGQTMPLPLMMVNDRGSHMVSVAMPIQRMKAVQGALLLSTRDGEIDGIRRKERHFITWIFIVALVATALTALALAGTIARPMRKLSEAALAVKRNISAAKDLPTFPDHKDEIGQMASAFRDMTLALYKRIELSEKFAADVAHELKNPVAAVSGAAQSLSYVKNDKDRTELLDNIQTDLKRLDKLISDIWNLSKIDADLSLSESERVDIRKLAAGVASVFNDMRGNEHNPKPVTMQVQAVGPGRHEQFHVNGHESRLGQVLTNLVDNALSFSPSQGRVWVRLKSAGGLIELDVEDEGPGIPEDAFEKIFERFYTDRPDSEATQGKNSGLGLSITQEIVEAHAGRIWVENRLGDDGATVLGARFRVTLPAMRTGSSGDAARAIAAAATR
jgi:two-component system, OmpR family, sensor histidine kinase ChvG